MQNYSLFQLFVYCLVSVSRFTTFCDITHSRQLLCICVFLMPSN